MVSSMNEGGCTKRIKKCLKIEELKIRKLYLKYDLDQDRLVFKFSILQHILSSRWTTWRREKVRDEAAITVQQAAGRVNEQKSEDMMIMIKSERALK